MALPVLSGQGTVIAKDGVKFSFVQGGKLAMAKFAIAFSKSKKDEYGEWVQLGEIFVDATAFGKLAEFINDNVKHLDQVDVSLEAEVVKFERKDGTPGQAVQGVVRSIGAPFRRQGAKTQGGASSDSTYG